MYSITPTRKKIALIAGILLSLLFVVIFSAYGWLQSNSGKQQLVRWIEAAANNGDTKLAIGSLEGSVPSAMVLTDIWVSDSAGVWLKVDRVEYRWHPWSLLKGLFRVEELAIQTVDLLRKPILPETEIEAPPQENSEPFTGIPVALSIDRLVAEKIRLGETVLGEEVQLTLNSQMAYLGLSEGLLLNLNLKRIDQTPGKVDLEISFLPLSKTFVMGLNAEEPAGGLLVHALQVPDLPEMSAIIKGEGTLDDWQGRFNFHAGPFLGVEGRAGLKTIASEQYALDLTMKAKLASYIPPELLDVWGDSVDLSTRVVSESFKKITIQKLNVSHPAVHLDVGGDVDLGEGEMSMRYTLTAGDDKAYSTMVPDVQWNSLKLSGSAEGLFLQPKIDVTIEGKDLRALSYAVSLTNAQLQITPDQPLNQKGFKLAVRGGGLLNGLSGPDLSLKKIIPEKMTWGLLGNIDLDHQKIDLEQFEFLSDLANFNLKGQLNQWGEQAKVNGVVNLPELSKFTELAQTKLTGNLNLDLSVESEEYGKTIFTRFDTLIENMVTDFPDVNTLAGERISIAGKVSLAKDGLIHVDALKFNGVAISGVLNATLTEKQAVEADLSVTLPRLAVLSAKVGKNLSGQLHVKTKIQGILSSPRITASIESKNLVFDGIPVEKGRGDVTAGNLQKSPTGTLATHIKANEWEATTSTDFALQPDDRLSLKKIKVAGSGAEILGDLLVDLKSTSVNGTLNGRILDYSTINDIIKQDISGNTVLTVNLSNADGQTVNFAAQVDDFNLKGESPLSIKSVGLSGKVTHALTEPIVESKLQVSALSHSAAKVNNLVLTTQGSLKAMDVSLEADAMPTAGPEANVKSTGKLSMADASQEFQLKTLAGKVGKIPFQLTQPALIKVNATDLELSQFAMKIQDGQVSSNFKKNSEGLFGDFTVDHFPLNIVNQLVPGLGVHGDLKGKAVFDGNFENPKGNLKFSVTQLKFDQATKQGLAPATVDLQGTWEKGLTKVDLNFTQPSVGEFKANGEIPLVMVNDPTGISIPAKAPLKGSAKGQLGLDILNDILVASGNQIRGKVDLAVQAGGTIDAPQVAGTVKFLDGEFENLKLGTSLKSIEILTSFDRNQFILDSLSARTPKDGTIFAKGTIKKSGEDDFIADLKLNTKSAQLVAIDTITSQVTSDLHLLGSIKSPALKGGITINHTEIYVPNKLPPSVVVLEVEETDGNEDEIEKTIKIESAKKEDPGFDMALDLKIKAPGQIFVRGRGLDAELEGDLQVTGTTNKPKVDGAFKLRRGTLNILNRKVKFKQGVVRFDGVPAREPDLDFKAEIPAQNMTILISVLGAVSDPKIKLSSDPEMPQDEILSNFLFDKSAGSMTPIEPVQLANSAAQLAGMGGQGAGVMDKVRGSLGLDTLKFSGDDSGPGVEAGRYVAEGVYVGVKQGLGEDSSGAILEYEVTPNITVESDIGADAKSRVGISMEWDY
ncbi:MAG: translocation/assembly module TamB domain-containing protein [Nitrospinae bacterium]|nr:translocation/assembly module TamB domain-containing protein [Nitrospinota bacterium]MDA1108363.1 translocation/assembly module TamB domain-containing protein [Nitrospinota bacterium]